jgi:16S rRNA (cytosine967-C5)-methyltransferase
VARHWLTLVAVLSSRLQHAWPGLQPEVQAALLVGAAQLLFLERLPDHAVINESVEWIKSRVPAASRIVNAVLRRVADLRRQRVGGEGRLTLERDEIPLHDGRVLQLGEPVFDKDPLERLAGQTSHPRPLLERWVERYGDKKAAELAHHDLVHPPIIVTGLTAEPTASALAVHEEAGCAVVEGMRARRRQRGSRTRHRRPRWPRPRISFRS